MHINYDELMKQIETDDELESVIQYDDKTWKEIAVSRVLNNITTVRSSSYFCIDGLTCPVCGYMRRTLHIVQNLTCSDCHYMPTYGTTRMCPAKFACQDYVNIMKRYNHCSRFSRRITVGRLRRHIARLQKGEFDIRSR